MSIMSGARNIEWIGDSLRGRLRLLDQTRLPEEEFYLDCTDTQMVWDAIQRLSVRGAPALGIVAAYACVLGMQHIEPGQPASEKIDQVAAHLTTSRPTAVTLIRALDRMRQVRPVTSAALLDEARRIHDEDRRMCGDIGRHALPLLERCVRGAAGGGGWGADPLQRRRAGHGWHRDGHGRHVPGASAWLELLRLCR